MMNVIMGRFVKNSKCEEKQNFLRSVPATYYYEKKREGLERILKNVEYEA